MVDKIEKYELKISTNYIYKKNQRDAAWQYVYL